jgi:bacillopeptidase F
MAGRYRTSRERNKSRYYILLSVIFVIVLMKWGIPFFIDVVAGKGATRQTVDKDVIPPQAPTLSALPDATNSAFLLVEGYTEPLAALDILINDKISVTDKAKEDGSFSSIATLDADSNRVQVRATDEAGNFSVSEVDIVSLDRKPIEITISSPKDGSEFFGKNSQIVDIKGETNKPDSQVIINSSFVVLDKDGGFVHRIQLQNGNNEIKVIASDSAGNSAEMIFTLLYTP